MLDVSSSFMVKTRSRTGVERHRPRATFNKHCAGLNSSVCRSLVFLQGAYLPPRLSSQAPEMLLAKCKSSVGSELNVTNITAFI